MFTGYLYNLRTSRTSNSHIINHASQRQTKTRISDSVLALKFYYLKKGISKIPKCRTWEWENTFED